MKFIKIIGYFLIFSSFLMIFIKMRYNFLNERYTIRFLLSICSLGFFLLAFDGCREIKKAEENFEPILFTERKGIFMSVLMGSLLLLCAIFI
ncbi:MAG: hypothetical protein K6E51_03535 [Treponema sp.]|nr:hypothetical protein [Treponema sp.]